jgi:Ras GTPase-activating-like protein IQGAP2/3
MSENNITQNDILYMETKAIYVQLIRSLPHLSNSGALGLDLDYIAETAATTKDAQLVRKGIKVKDMLRELEDMGIIDHRDRYKLLVEEITQELAHLGNLKEKVLLELTSLESVYKTILDHNTYLRGQLESYKAYLQNVRIQSSGAEKQTKKSVGIGVQVSGTYSGGGGGGGGLGDGGHAGHVNSKKKGSDVQGPFKFSYSQLEKDGVISQSNVPESRYVVG